MILLSIWQRVQWASAVLDKAVWEAITAGKASKTFSHNKSIVKKANWIDLPFRYHPYTKCKDRLVRMFLK